MNGNRNGNSESLIRIELISYFHRNQDKKCTAIELADSIGRDMPLVERQIEKLVQIRILERELCDGQYRYGYISSLSPAIPSKKSRARVAGLQTLNESRKYRV